MEPGDVHIGSPFPIKCILQFHRKTDVTGNCHKYPLQKKMWLERQDLKNDSAKSGLWDIFFVASSAPNPEA
jgi:hypothetical protein